MGDSMKILLIGDEKSCEFYSLYLSNKGAEVFSMVDVNSTVDKPNFVPEIALIVSKASVYSIVDMIESLKLQYPELFIMPVLQEKNEMILDSMFQSGVEKILFDFNPDSIYREIQKIYSKRDAFLDKKSNKKLYMINFYENKDSFIIDITGSLEKEKIGGLKLMFMNYLNNKINKLKSIIYVFNNADETSVTFQPIWMLFRLWKNLGISYNKIYYLMSSDMIKESIRNYASFLGVKNSPNLIEIVKKVYPEEAKKGEMELFDFASALLQAQGRRKN
ncbi:MAG: hypothetical protein BWX91_01410 [Spirochaetes bacterium ADurb.Bin133]|jgi:hypothetical protein|nr:MAG: hypothetical protein BWX91_01410 [Spirochaetes bacterium ADurb.Bin133]